MTTNNPKPGIKQMCKRTKSKYQPNGGAWIRADKRLAIYLRDDFCCAYCLESLNNSAPFDITLDHIKCKSDGGDNNEGNLITACRSCNSSRQDKTLAQFCGPETRKYIKRNTRRSLKKYRVLAKALIAGTTGS